MDEEEDLIGIEIDGVLRLGAAGARLSPYLLGGGGGFFASGDAEAAANAGVGR